MATDPHKVLRTVFGYTEFLPMQEPIIDAVLEGRDVLAVLPTGGGKSLCYQIPALVQERLAVVVSPLIALMRDQVQFLQGLGIDARVLNSSLDPAEWRENAAAARSGSVRLLYLAPETLASPRAEGMLAALEESRLVGLLAVDEAHCISEWGHDFRPEYRLLGGLRGRFPKASCLALTATATERVRDDIASALKLKSAKRFVAGFDRPNIRLEVRRRGQLIDQIVEAAPKGPGIVYCFSRARTEEMAAGLSKRGLPALPYHAGLPDEVRSENQDRFLEGKIRIITATTAFGMGIDKANVRFVMHADLPKSLEQYYQEVGRAGRDGEPALAVLFYSYADVRKIKSLLADKEGKEAEAAEESLAAMVRYADSDGCRRAALLAHFGEEYPKSDCGSCDVCLGTTDASLKQDVTVQAYKLLSCVKRTGERYGAGHVVDVLIGSNNDRVVGLGHDNLSTWGIGKEWEKGLWLDLARQLVRSGYLDRSQDWQVLSLTRKAVDALRDRLPIEAAVAPEKSGGHRSRRSAPAAAGPAAPEDPALGKALRALRKSLAAEGGIPPFMVFSDRTLRDLMAKRPADRSDLLRVYGMGEAKVEHYGARILAALHDPGE